MTLDIAKLRQESPREFDAAVNEKVLGWPTAPASRVVTDAFRPSEYPTSDYAVLCYVREQWNAEQRHKFKSALEKMWYQRDPDAWGGFMDYVPGDFAHAALAVAMAAQPEDFTGLNVTSPPTKEA